MRGVSGHCSVDNPIDLTDEIDAKRYQIALDALLGLDHNDAAIVVVMIQIALLDLDIVDRLVAIIRKYNKPLVACTAGGRYTMKGGELLENVGFPALPTPARAVKAICALVKFGEIKRKVEKKTNLTKLDSLWLEPTISFYGVLVCSPIRFFDILPPFFTCSLFCTFFPVFRLWVLINSFQ